MIYITQRHVDMAMWQAFIMANGDPNYGDLQDAWDADGEGAMRHKAICLSNKVWNLWNTCSAEVRKHYTISDFCEAYLKLCYWKCHDGLWSIFLPRSDEAYLLLVSTFSGEPHAD